MYNKTKFCAHWFKNYKWLLIFKIKYMIDWVRLELHVYYLQYNFDWKNKNLQKKL